MLKSRYSHYLNDQFHYVSYYYGFKHSFDEIIPFPQNSKYENMNDFRYTILVYSLFVMFNRNGNKLFAFYFENTSDVTYVTYKKERNSRMFQQFNNTKY